MLTQTLEYALRAVVHLAEAAPGSSTSQQISREMQIPHAYLFKVLKNLERAGIVRMRRGNRGGVSLGHEPETVTVLDVVNAVDPIRRVTTCPLKLQSHATRLCRLHKRLDHVLAEAEKAFAQTTLAEIIAEPNECGGPVSTK